MHAELSFVPVAGHTYGDDSIGIVAAHAAGFAGGVQWLGRADRSEGRRAAPHRDREHTVQPAILGTAHGPRLLELICMAG